MTPNLDVILAKLTVMVAAFSALAGASVDKWAQLLAMAGVFALCSIAGAIWERKGGKP